MNMETAPSALSSTAPPHWSVELSAGNKWSLVYDATPGGSQNPDGSKTFALRVPVAYATDWLDAPERTLAVVMERLNGFDAMEAILTKLRGHLNDGLETEHELECPASKYERTLIAEIDAALPQASGGER